MCLRRVGAGDSESSGLGDDTSRTGAPINIFGPEQRLRDDAAPFRTRGDGRKYMYASVARKLKSKETGHGDTTDQLDQPMRPPLPAWLARAAMLAADILRPAPASGSL
eukprot:scaffold1668_cov202-Prasinococcus_capsulatus_cf.AAC.1